MKMKNEQKLRIKVGGMHCAACATKIEKGLSELDGVERAQVNFALGTAAVDFESGKSDQKKVFDKISQLGYSPSEAEATMTLDNVEVVQARKSFLTSLAFLIPLLIFSFGSIFLPNVLGNPKFSGIVMFLLSLPILFYAGREIFTDAWVQTRHFSANMNSLIGLGSLAAFLYSFYVLIDIFIFKKIVNPHFYFETATMIITLILLGRFLEARAKGRARDAIGALMRLRPEKATAIINDTEVEIEVAAIHPGMIIYVKPGEKVPADGKVIEGTPALNEAMLTGESMPVDKVVGDPVIGGSVNGNSSFKFEVTGVGEDTFLSSIVRLVVEAQNKKAPVQRLADKIAGVFVPIVLLIAITTLVAWYLLDPGSHFVLTAPVAVLIIACPCALGLATPTAILAGTGRAARRGVYFRGGDIIENCDKTDYVIFDKTGTLTYGEFEVRSVKSIDEEKDNELIGLAASVESGSQHPLAAAVVNKAKAQEINLSTPKNLVESPGFGLKGEVNDIIVITGNEATMKKEKIDISELVEEADKEMSQGRTVIFVAADGQALGFLALADKIKDEAAEVIDSIHKSGREVVLLTGDNHKTAQGVANVLGIDKFEAGIKPDQKAVIVETFRRADHKVMMVGDGINDAPALASANIGVALGSGTDVAIESADVILVRENLKSLIEALDISRLTLRTIKQNLFWALFYNVIAIPLAAGLFYPIFHWSLSPVIAAAAMAFSSLFVVSNSLRLLNVKKS
jgi:P-type Cu+ transporter